MHSPFSLRILLAYNLLEINCELLVCLFVFLFLFFLFYYSYVHTRLGSFLSYLFVITCLSCFLDWTAHEKKDLVHSVHHSKIRPSI
jgi:hypothetical protein